MYDGAEGKYLRPKQMPDVWDKKQSGVNVGTDRYK